MIHSLVVGTGSRLFRDQLPPVRSRLVDSKPTTSRVLIITYAPADALAAASTGAESVAGNSR